MLFYPKMADNLNLEWTTDCSNILVKNAQTGSLVAKLSIKEVEFLNQLDGETDPDDIISISHSERFKMLSKFATKGLLVCSKTPELSVGGLGTILFTLPTPAFERPRANIVLCLYYLCIRYLWLPLFVACGTIILINSDFLLLADDIISTFADIGIICISVILHELGHTAAAHYYGVPTEAVGIGLKHFLPCAFISCDLLPFTTKNVKRQIAIAGPTTNIMFACLFFLGCILSKSNYMYWAALYNVIIAIVNLIPLSNLDGAIFLNTFPSKSTGLLSLRNIEPITLGGCAIAGLITILCTKIFPLWLEFILTEFLAFVVAIIVTSNSVANFFIWGCVCAFPVGYSLIELLCTIDLTAYYRIICVIVCSVLVATAFTTAVLAIIDSLTNI